MATVENNLRMFGVHLDWVQQVTDGCKQRCCRLSDQARLPGAAAAALVGLSGDRPIRGMVPLCQVISAFGNI